MKREVNISKQEFAKLVLHLYANYVKSFHYDAFYDLPMLIAVAEGDKSKAFYLMFRQTGSDYVPSPLLDGDKVAMRERSNFNHIVLYVEYNPKVSDRTSGDAYFSVHIEKDKNEFLDYYQVQEVQS